MKAKEWMTRDVETCGPETSMNEAAHKMWAGDNGVLPVAERAAVSRGAAQPPMAS